jgi:hypothetical protein
MPGAGPPAPPPPGASPPAPPAAVPAVAADAPPPPAAQVVVERQNPALADPARLERLRGCTVACPATVTGLADLPSVEAGGVLTEVALVRLTVRRPEGDTDCCVRQHVPSEIRGLLAPGSGVMALAHESDPRVVIVDWKATGAWIGTNLTVPQAPEQYDWPPHAEWPAPGEIEIHDVNGHSEEMEQRRTEWRFSSADLLSLTPLPSRVDRREEWRITLELRNGKTVAVKDRVPLLALARLRNGSDDRVRTPIDVLVSPQGELAIDWEATLRQRELRSRVP